MSSGLPRRSDAARAAHYLVFSLAESRFAIDVCHVREILDVGAMTVVPNAPSAVRGIINVRGRGVTVIELRRRFGLPPADDTIQTRIMVLEVPSNEGEPLIVGALADVVRDVLTIQCSELRPPPPLSTTEWTSTHCPSVVSSVTQRGEHFLMVLDLPRVFVGDHPRSEHPDEAVGISA